MKAEAFNIGTIINKQLLASNAIFQLMIDADSSSSKCLALTDAEVARLEIKSDSVLLEDAVKNLRLPRELTFAGLIRNGNGMLVTGSTRFQEGDQVLVFCLSGALHKVEKLFNRH
jgi:trk system potassium uptake protein TrkA